LNFKDVGVNTLKASQAFKKIRTYSKTYTTNLNYVPFNTSTKYALMNKLYLDNNSFTDSLSYGTETQHTMSASKAASSNYSTFLDTNARMKFLNSNRGLNTELYGNQLETPSVNSLIKTANFTPSKTAPSTLSTLESNLTSSQAFTNLLKYPGLVNTINDDSDKKKFLYPHTKVINTRLGSDYEFKNLNVMKQSTLATALNSNVTSFANALFNNTNTNSKLFTLSSSNQGVLTNDRVIRRFSNLSPKGSNFNLSHDLNSLSADTRFKEQFSLSNSASNYYEKQQSM